MLLTKMLRLQL